MVKEGKMMAHQLRKKISRIAKEERRRKKAKTNLALSVVDVRICIRRERSHFFPFFFFSLFFYHRFFFRHIQVFPPGWCLVLRRNARRKICEHITRYINFFLCRSNNVYIQRRNRERPERADWKEHVVPTIIETPIQRFQEFDTFLRIERKTKQKKILEIAAIYLLRLGFVLVQYKLVHSNWKTMLNSWNNDPSVYLFMINFMDLIFILINQHTKCRKQLSKTWLCDDMENLFF